MGRFFETFEVVNLQQKGHCCNQPNAAQRSQMFEVFAVKVEAGEFTDIAGHLRQILTNPTIVFERLNQGKAVGLMLKLQACQLEKVSLAPVIFDGRRSCNTVKMQQ